MTHILPLIKMCLCIVNGHLIFQDNLELHEITYCRPTGTKPVLRNVLETTALKLVCMGYIYRARGAH